MRALGVLAVALLTVTSGVRRLVTRTHGSFTEDLDVFTEVYRLGYYIPDPVAMDSTTAAIARFCSSLSSSHSRAVLSHPYMLAKVFEGSVTYKDGTTRHGMYASNLQGILQENDDYACFGFMESSNAKRSTVPWNKDFEANLALDFQVARTMLRKELDELKAAGKPGNACEEIQVVTLNSIPGTLFLCSINSRVTVHLFAGERDEEFIKSTDEDDLENLRYLYFTLSSESSVYLNWVGIPTLIPREFSRFFPGLYSLERIMTVISDEYLQFAYTICLQDVATSPCTFTAAGDVYSSSYASTLSPISVMRLGFPFYTYKLGYDSIGSIGLEERIDSLTRILKWTETRKLGSFEAFPRFNDPFQAYQDNSLRDFLTNSLENWKCSQPQKTMGICQVTSHFLDQVFQEMDLGDSYFRALGYRSAVGDSGIYKYCRKHFPQ